MFALLGLFLTDLKVMPDNYSQYVDIILCILVTAGIISNPTDGSFYFDTPKSTIEKMKQKALEQAVKPAPEVKVVEEVKAPEAIEVTEEVKPAEVVEEKK